MAHSNGATPLERLGGDSLPALPYVAHEILVATSTNDVNISEVAATLAREPGLAARIVAVANYAFFSRHETLYSLDRAIQRIGLNRVRVLATSLLLNRIFDSTQCPAFHLERYWHDAISTAFCSARLAMHTAPEHPPEAAYLGGVLHNIGLMLLVHAFPKAMNEVLLERQADPEKSLAALTFQAVGCNYSEAGEMLLREWDVPGPIVTIAGNTHRESYAGEYATLVATVRFAHHWMQQEFGLNGVQPPPPIGPQKFERIAMASREEREALSAFAQLLAQG